MRGHSRSPIAAAAQTVFTVPADAAGSQIHLILEVADNNPIASLHAYRRIVIDVQ